MKLTPIIVFLGLTFAVLFPLGAQSPDVVPVVTNAAPNAMQFDFYDTYSMPKAAALGVEYETNLRQGCFDEADSALGMISFLFPGDAEKEQFWQKIIPDGQRRMLVLAQICPDCKDGHCPACRGAGVCPSCQGRKYCPECQGKGAFAKTCSACRCRQCNATGLCQACGGNKIAICPVCRGTGMGKQEFKKKTCSRCGGSGQYMKAVCPVCRGTGTIAYYSTPQCARCSGKGRINCEECGGTGKCRLCNGKGRLPECAQCNGRGVLVKTCSLCGGSGQCACCQNTGGCPVCKGSGICPRCNRSGLIVRRKFPIQTGWVRLGVGAILHRESPAPTNRIFEGAGSFEAGAGRHDLRLNVQSNEVLCIFENEQLDWIKRDVMQ